ncbi:unnamed protein product [Staurois parvus]|uniref:Epsin-2 n=1 Tax=Staurois parvus TaxID=386267 RepID=A0ABN9AUN0_9NEOB|nr:unnamed protein product [Staurois parvus]
MSREVAEQEERIRRGDDLRLQMALEESRKDTIKGPKKKSQQQPSLLDLIDALPPGAPAPPKSEPWAAASVPKSKSQPDPWGATAASPTSRDPWQSFGGPSFDPFSNLNGTVRDDFSEFDSLRSTSKVSADSLSTLPSLRSGTTSPELFDSQPVAMTTGKQAIARKTPESFLGPNAALVNLETLVTMPTPPAPTFNPFLASGQTAPASTPAINPFQVNQPQALTLNQLRSSPMMGVAPSFNNMPAMANEASIPPPLQGMSTLPAVPPAGMNINMAANLPHHNNAISPSNTQAMNATNPFLL